ncbi:MAG: hypothetical protein JWM74_104 [Myxococcaceae bacterium]|nr:hypothetical protein [Myxococcaceae bacterium]
MKNAIFLPLFAVVALVGACSSKSGGTVDGAPHIAGFDPPGPAEGQVQIFSPVVHAVPAGADYTHCSYIANPFGDREVDVVKAEGFESKWGHHALLMAVKNGYKAGDSHECGDADMNDARFLAGATDAAANVKIPDGIGFRIAPGGVMLVQTHWINTSASVIEGQASFNVTLKPHDGSRQNAQLFASFTSELVLPPRGPAHAVSECVIQEPLQFFDLGGHAHEWGRNVKVEKITAAGETSSLYDEPWLPEYTSNPPQRHYELSSPLTFAKGDTVRVTCDWQNTTNEEIGFPREMCVVFGMIFPADADIHCQDGAWSVLR